MVYIDLLVFQPSSAVPGLVWLLWFVEGTAEQVRLDCFFSLLLHRTLLLILCVMLDCDFWVMVWSASSILSHGVHCRSVMLDCDFWVMIADFFFIMRDDC